MDSRKLAVLADAARLDAPCGGRGSRGPTAAPLLPSDVEPSAIYESVAADGRKVLLIHRNRRPDEQPSRRTNGCGQGQ